MLTSLCLSASMHGQIRLKHTRTHTYHCHHHLQLSWLQCYWIETSLLDLKRMLLHSFLLAEPNRSHIVRKRT